MLVDLLRVLERHITSKRGRDHTPPPAPLHSAPILNRSITLRALPHRHLTGGTSASDPKQTFPDCLKRDLDPLIPNQSIAGLTVQFTLSRIGLTMSPRCAAGCD